MATWKKVNKDIDGGTWGSLKWILVGIVTIVLIIGGVSLFSVNAERVIVKSSFQYKEGKRAEAAIYEANIVELDAMIALGPDNVNELRAQRAAVNARLSAIKVNE